MSQNVKRPFSIHSSPNPTVPKKRGRPRKPRPVLDNSIDANEEERIKNLFLAENTGQGRAGDEEPLHNNPVVVEKVVLDILRQAGLTQSHHAALDLPQPANLELCDMANIFCREPSSSSDYFVSLKADGIRCLVVTFLLPDTPPAFVLVSRTGRVSTLWVDHHHPADASKNTWFDPPSVFDAELCVAAATGKGGDEEVALQVFDILVCRGRNLSASTYFERMEVAKYHLWRFSSQPRPAPAADASSACGLLPEALGDKRRQGVLCSVRARGISTGKGPLDSLRRRGGGREKIQASSIPPPPPPASLLQVHFFAKPVFHKVHAQSLVRFLGTTSPHKPSSPRSSPWERFLKEFEYDGLIFTPNQATYAGRPISTKKTRKGDQHPKKTFSSSSSSSSVLKSFKWKPKSMTTVDFYLCLPGITALESGLEPLPKYATETSGYAEKLGDLLPRTRSPWVPASAAMFLAGEVQEGGGRHGASKNKGFLYSYLPLAPPGSTSDMLVRGGEGVYECQWHDDREGRWSIVRKRDDKNRPNGILTCLSALSTILENIRFDFLQ